jgi:hypothetical protein
VDRLDRLTQRLIDEMDQQTELPSRDCLGAGLLGRFATGDVDPPTRARVEAHLDECLTCVHRYVELRDDLHAIAAPEPVSPRLRQTLERLIEDGRERFPSRVGGRLRRAFVFRVPAWAVVGVAAGIMVITWTVAHNLQRPGAPGSWPVDFSRPGQLVPMSQEPRTVSGVVSSIHDATSNGVEAHIVSLKDTSGATYVLFAWGRPTVGPGDSVEIDGIVTRATPSARTPVYQGVATQLRRGR